MTIKPGRGGDLMDVLKRTLNQPGSFDKRYTLCDKDRGSLEIKKAEEYSKKNKINLLFNTPCLEGLFLSILGEGKSYINEKSLICKRKFEEKYISSKYRQDIVKYKQIFTKSILDKKKKSIKILATLISIFE